MIARHMRIEGRVHGGCFRQSMIEEADRLGVTGWVRNRRDGSVEAVASGPAGAVEGLIDWARRGPPGARVTRVEVSLAELPAAGASPGFDWRPSE